MVPGQEGEPSGPGGDHPWKMSAEHNVLDVVKVNKSFHDPVTVPVLKDD